MSKKYNIPKRTLYDKLKKMGLTSGRQRQRKSMNTGLPGLPQMPHLTLVTRIRKNPYKSLLHRMELESGSKDNNEEESVASGPRRDLGAKPFSILPPHLKLKMMERIQGEEKEKLVEESKRQEQEAEVERSPINLGSTWNLEKRMSEGRLVVIKSFILQTR